MVAFSTVDGLTREAEVRLEAIAVDAATVCRLFGYTPGASIVELEKQPGFPVAITPTGGAKRWLVAELKAWAENQARRGTSPAMVRGPRSSAKTKAAEPATAEAIQ